MYIRPHSRYEIIYYHMIPVTSYMPVRCADTELLYVVVRSMQLVILSTPGATCRLEGNNGGG